MNHEIIVRADPEGVAQEAAKRFVQWAQAAAADRGRFRVALAGGGTPGALYRLLAGEPYRSETPWTQTDVFWGDERHLPPGHAGRNDTAVLPLLAQAGVPAAQIHSAPYLAGEPDLAAQQYEVLLRNRVQPGAPLFDLIILGVGNDGHVASLFPGTMALAERQRLVVANYAAYEDRHPERVTLTLPAINASAVVLFLVTGANKRAVLQRVLHSPESPALPAQRVRPLRGRLIWLVDQAAASTA